MTSAPAPHHFPKIPDWGIYAAIVFALLVAALSRGERADAPPAPPPPGPGEGAALRAATPFDPAIVIKAPPPAPQSAGTAFALGSQGVWISAAHVLEGCTQPALMIAPGRGVAAKLRIDPTSDVAVLTTVGGAEPLPSGLGQTLRVGARGFHPGYPQGRPGEVTSRLLGRQTLVMRRGSGVRSLHPEPVMAWAEVGRTDGLRGGLAGLSGGPVLDTAGRVVGVTVAEAPRRGRIYTVAPEAVGAALQRAGLHGLASPPLGEPITVENYGRSADALRRDLRVVQVACLKRDV